MMRHLPWLRRMVVGITIFCLVVTNFGIQSVQASPLTAGSYATEVELYLMSSGPFCTDGEYSFYGSFEITDPAGEAEGVFGGAQVRHKTKIGKAALYSGCKASAIDCNTPGSDFPKVWFYRINTFELKYTAPSEAGTEHVTVDVYDSKGKRLGGTFKDFKVISCKYSLHGTTDLGGPINAMMSSPFWEAVGTYDVAGTLETQEDGSLKGEAVASQYLDALFLGGVEDVTCNHVTPWEGNTTVDLEADPKAWANEGVLALKLAVQPMQVNTTQVACRSSTGGGSAASPPFTVASFDLDFSALPAEGGTTSLDFQFPNGRATFHIELIVTPQEAGS